MTESSDPFSASRLAPHSTRSSRISPGSFLRLRSNTRTPPPPRRFSVSVPPRILPLARALYLKSPVCLAGWLAGWLPARLPTRLPTFPSIRCPTTSPLDLATGVAGPAGRPGNLAASGPESPRPIRAPRTSNASADRLSFTVTVLAHVRYRSPLFHGRWRAVPGHRGISRDTESWMTRIAQNKYRAGRRTPVEVDTVIRNAS